MTGWCPQFESGAVLIPRKGRPMLLGGPESEPFAKMDSPHEGGSFKWLDYSSVLDKPIEFGILMVANRERVESVQQSLFDMMTTLQGIVRV